MNKKIITVAAALGLSLGGVTFSQVFLAQTYNAISTTPLDKLPDMAYDLGSHTATGGDPAAATEVSNKLAYIQIRQNAEIIRLLTLSARGR